MILFFGGIHILGSKISRQQLKYDHPYTATRPHSLHKMRLVLVREKALRTHGWALALLCARAYLHKNFGVFRDLKNKERQADRRTFF